VDIEKVIDKLSSNSAGGPNGFPAILLNKLNYSFLNPYTLCGENPWT